MAEFSLGTAALGTEVDLSGLDKGISSAEQASSKGFSRIGETISSALKIGVVAAGGAVASAFAAVAGPGLAFNNTMEQVSAQLNAFTKDGAKSAEILEMIKDRASKTPFEFEAMAQAATALLPASKSSGIALEDLIAKAEILAASNPAEGLEGAAFALKEAVSGDFASVIERFNLPRQRLNELKEQGVPALEAVQIAMQELGLDTDLVTNLANTASGRWSTLKDTWTGLAATITAPIFDVASQGLAGINDWITANQPAIDAFAKSLAEGVKSAIDWIVTTGVPALVSGWQTVQPVLATVGSAFDTIIGAARPLIDTFTSAEDPAQGFLDVLSQLSPTFALLRGIVEAALPAIQSIVESVFGIISGFIAEHGGKILSDSQTIWSQVQSVVETVWNAIQGFINAVLPPIQEIVSTIFGAIATFLEQNGGDIQAFLGQTWDGIAIIIQTALAIIQAVFTTVLPIIQTIVVTVFSFIAGYLSDHSAQIQAILSGAWAIIKGMIQVSIALVQGILSTALALIRGDWSGAWTAIQTMFSSIWEGIKTILSGALGIVASLLSSAWEDIKSVASTAWEKIKSTISTVADNIVSVLSALPGKMRDIGGQIIDGIISGVSGAAGRLTSKLESIARDALNSAKSALGISSPSRLFAAEVGSPIVYGILAGMQDAMPDLLAGLQTLGDDMLDKARDIAAEVSDALADGFDATADIDRQKARNFKALGDAVHDAQAEVSKARSTVADAQSQLAEAQRHLAEAQQVQDESAIAKAQDQVAAAQADLQSAEQERDAAALRAAQAAELQSTVRSQLAEAEQQASQFDDPEQAANFFKMRSDQIMELADLEQDWRDAMAEGDSAQANRIAEQVQLLQHAQQAEQQAFSTRQQGQMTRAEQIAGQIADLLNEIDLEENPEAWAVYNQLATLANKLGGPPVLLAPAPLGAGPGDMSSAMVANMPGPAGTVVNIDARQTTDPGGVENAVKRALAAAGIKADVLMRTR